MRGGLSALQWSGTHHARESDPALPTLWLPCCLNIDPTVCLSGWLGPTHLAASRRVLISGGAAAGGAAAAAAAPILTSPSFSENLARKVGSFQYCVRVPK
jgi:hypothetical protein